MKSIMFDQSKLHPTVHELADADSIIYACSEIGNTLRNKAIHIAYFVISSSCVRWLICVRARTAVVCPTMITKTLRSRYVGVWCVG